MKQLFVLAAILFASFTAKAQRLYNLEYTDDNEVQHDCFMVYYNPNNCYMRDRFLNPDSSYTVVHTDYVTVAGKTKFDKQYLILKADASSTRLIMGDSAAKDSYIPENFFWYPQEKTALARGPFKTRDLVDLTLNGSASRYMLYTPQNLKENDLLEYYLPTEGDFEDIKNMYSIGSDVPERFTPPLYVVKPTLHFIIAANTDIDDIGKYCKVDRDNLLKEMKMIADSLKINFKPYIIDGAQFTKAKMISKIKEVVPAANDIVFFAYSGHGSRWNNVLDTMPYMALWVKPIYDTVINSAEELKQAVQAIQDNSIDVSSVVKMITNKPGRLKIVLGDLCNDYNGAQRPPRRTLTDESYDISAEGERSSGFKGLFVNKKNTEKLYALFIKSVGNVISVATKPAEKAGSNKNGGGFFTTGFLDALAEETSFMGNDTPSWSNIIANTIDNAKTYRRNSGSMKPQTGLQSVKVK